MNRSAAQNGKKSPIIITLIALALTLALTLPSAKADLTEGLTHYYSFNETGATYYDRGMGPRINITGTDNTDGIFNQAYEGGTERSGSGPTHTIGPSVTVRAYLYIPGTDVYRMWALYDDSNNGIAMHYGDNKFKFFFYEGAGLYDIGETTNTYTDAGWYKIVARANSTTNTIEMYVNGTLDGITATGAHSGIGGIDIIRVNGDLGSTGCTSCRIDELAIWNRSVIGGDFDTIINTDFGFSNIPSITDPFQVYANNTYTGKTINSFNVSIGGVLWSTNNGTVTTNYNNSEPETLTVNVSAGPGWSSTEYTTSTASDLTAQIYKVYDVLEWRWSNYTAYGGLNYTRALNYSVWFVCEEAGEVAYYTEFNDSYSNNFLNNTDCSGPQYYEHTFLPPAEGVFNLSLFQNVSVLPSVNNENWTRTHAVADLRKPNVVLYNLSVPSGFVNPSVNLTYQCNDTEITPLLLYNLTVGGNELFYGNVTPNFYITNTTSVNEDSAESTAYCADFFSSNATTTNTPIFARQISLIDERNAGALDLTTLSSAIVYFDENRSTYDFKSNATTTVNFTSGTNDKLRFELVYNDTNIITRWIDISLTDEDLRVCGNVHGVEHHEQFIISANQRPVLLESVYASCLVAGDYTRFAYQDANLLKAFTIDTMYKLKLITDGVTNVLAGVDGSIVSYYQVDQIEFAKEDLGLDLFGGALGFDQNTNTSLRIYYRREGNESVQSDVTITRLETGQVVYSDTITTSPDEFTITFDYSTLSPPVNSTSLFQISVTGTDADGTEYTTKRYFQINARSSVFPAGLALVFGVLLLVAGLTFAITRTTFSWFGVVLSLASLAVLTLATQTWYVVMFEAMTLIIAVYIVIVMFTQNQPTLA